ncbi:hypothetical protein LTR94_027645 [Friedmanniomyces endolithicus]|nr:hypothetical protein LTR94_027645 [Friedmanniomyces endolithicus]
MTDDTDEPYGLMLLRDWIAHDRQPPMGRTLGIRLVEAERGRVVFEGTPDRSVYNPLGGVHGGYAATMLELKVSYQRGLTERSGTGRLISLGRRVAFSEANLVDGDGRLCATATSTLLVFEAASGQRGAFQQ